MWLVTEVLIKPLKNYLELSLQLHWRIKQLEEFVGIKLRITTRRVIPTVEGENFVPVAERLVRDFDSAISDLKATAERRIGNVSIAVVPSVATQLLPPL